MKPHPFSPDFESLPGSLPVFPLSGVVLLPLGQLPLNIFEPRYLNMVFDALGQGRLIGIAQPENTEASGKALYKTGCVGRISAFSETADGRLLINLTGVCRFEIVEEIATVRGYRRFTVDWRRFEADLSEHEARLDTESLMASLDAYLQLKNIRVDKQSLKQMSSAALVNSLAVNLPFEPEEKQSLVETAKLSDRLELLITLTRMSLAGQGPAQPTRH